MSIVDKIAEKIGPKEGRTPQWSNGWIAGYESCLIDGIELGVKIGKELETIRGNATATSNPGATG